MTNTIPSLGISRKIWTRKDARMLAELGFPNANRLELVDGELIDHMGKKLPHSIWQHLIFAWLQVAFGVEFVQMELPIDVATEDILFTEPEPDIVVTAKRLREYKDNPCPQDILLLVEVSDSTVKFDLQTKAPIYARAGIVEYWVVDIPARLIHIHRDSSKGEYTNIDKRSFDEEISCLSKPLSKTCLDSL